MLILLLDEPVLFVYSSAEAAAREIEGPDIESELRAAFDDDARPYRVEWLRPNRWSKSFFGLIRSVDPGEYRLVPAGSPDRARLVELLEMYPRAHPPEAENALRELLLQLLTA